MSFGEDLGKLVAEHPEGLLGAHPSWQRVKLGDIANLTNGFAFKANHFSDAAGTPLLRIRDIIKGEVETYYNAPVDDPKMPYVSNGEIVVGMDGDFNSRIWAGGNTLINQRVCTLQADEQFYSQKLLSFALPAYLKLINDHTSSVTVKHLSSKTVHNIPLPLPPFNEQQRIVQKIDTLFAQIDRGQDAVREVQKLLIRYRQSVLKAAVTGELTADWRAERAGTLEHGRDVVARIQQGRCSQRNARPENSASSVSGSAKPPDLPAGWVWAKMEQLFDVYGGATPSRREPKNWMGNILWVSSGEVAFCRIRDTKEKITELGFNSCSTKLHPVGTVLLAMIGEGKTRGQAAILDVPACNNQNAAAIRVSETVVPSEFVYYYLLSTYDANRLKGQGGNQPALNGNKVKNFQLPVCSVDEMNEIVRVVDERFSNIEAMENWCRTELERSDSLRQAILKKAFAGKLVPQDATDEPAGTLLARIEAAKPSAKGSGRRTDK